MRKIIIILFVLVSANSLSQSKIYIGGDSVFIIRDGGNSTLVLRNSTKDTIGYLFNSGNGVTKFSRLDSTIYTSVYQNSLKQNTFIINVVDYGAKGDSLTDNTKTLRSIFSMASANKAWVYFPAGYYIISDTINIPYSCKITGNGGLRPYTGTIGASPVGVYARGSSVIIQTSGSKSGFVVNEDGVEINGMAFSCSASSSAAGAGIRIQKGNSFRMNNTFIGTFYNNLEILSGVDFNVWGNQFVNPINYNMYVGGAIDDEGCNSIYSNMFNSSLSPTATQLRVDAAPGIRIFDNEFHIATGQNVPSSLYPIGAIDINVTKSTSEPFIIGNGIEAYTNFGIRIRCANSVISVNKIVITGNQLQGYSSRVHDIDIQAFAQGKIKNVTITHNNIGQTGVLAAIYLKNITGVTLAGNNIASNDSAYSLRSDSLISCTNIFYKIKGVLILDSARFRTAPPTSTGGYELLTRNSTTGNVEKSITIGTGMTIGGVNIALGSDAIGDLYTRNSSGALIRIPHGTPAQTLRWSGSNYVWVDTSSVTRGSTTSDLDVPSTSTLGVSSAAAKYLIGSRNVQYRVGIGGSSQTIATANNDVAALVIADNNFGKATSGTHTLASGLEIVKQNVTSGTATITDFQNLYVDDAPTGGGNNWSANFGSVKYRSKSTWDATNTATGTTGNQTINKPSGTVNIAAAGTSVTVTNSLVTTSSIVFAVIRSNDGNGTSIKSVVPAAGSFTINVNTAPAAEISVAFLVIN